MRKILFSFICISSVFLLSCNESGLNIDEPNTIETHTYANKSMSEAISIAIDAAERLYPTQSRGYAHTASINNVRSVINHLSIAGENDTLLYVVNFDNNEGYAIIPAPNIDKKVLAVVGNGSYYPEKGTDNPGFNYFMEAAKSYASNAPINPLGYGDPVIVIPGDLHPAYKLEYDTLAHYEVKPRLDGMEWGQTGIYNIFCPRIDEVRAATGCVPTAIASIITGVKKVSDGTSSFSFTFPDNTFGTQSLMRQIGYDGNAKYGTNTQVAKDKCKSLLEKYLVGHKISKFTDFNFDRAKSSLNTCVLLMAGSGHAWVADGYDQLDYHKYSAKWDFTNKGWIVQTDRDYSDRLVHFCWGWD